MGRGYEGRYGCDGLEVGIWCAGGFWRMGGIALDEDGARIFRGMDGDDVRVSRVMEGICVRRGWS